MLVPTSPDDPASAANRKAWETLRAWTKPFLTAFSDKDAITRGGDRAFQRDVPGCAGQPHTTIEGGGHFLQEDCGERARAGRRRLDHRHERERRPPSTSSRSSTRCRRSRRPGLHYARTRSTASATTQLLAPRTREYADAHGARRRPTCALASRRDSATSPRRSAPTPRSSTSTTGSCSCAASTTTSGDSSRAGSTPTRRPEQTVVRELAEEVGLDGRVDAARRRVRPRGRRRRQPAQHGVGRVPLLE